MYVMYTLVGLSGIDGREQGGGIMHIQSPTQWPAWKWALYLAGAAVLFVLDGWYTGNWEVSALVVVIFASIVLSATDWIATKHPDWLKWFLEE